MVYTIYKEQALKRGQQVTRIAMGVVLLLIIVKTVVGLITGAIVLIADAVHSFSDLVVLIASWLGFKVASRPATKKFPYGFYRAESLAALFISLMIILAGLLLLCEGYKKLFVVSVLHYTCLALVVSLLASIISFFLAVWERRLGKKINANSLIATADDTMMDSVTSLLVFISIILLRFRVPYIEGVLTMLISVVLIRVGIKNGRIAVYSLMDATMQPEVIAKIKTVANSVSGVKGIGAVTVRQAGPFLFGELHLKVAGSTHVSTAHNISHEAEEKVKQKIPAIEALTVHIEPSTKG